MGKRKAIPAALHSEFTEYSSLIRALRTNNSLDVTSHITKPPPHGLETSLQIQHGLDELDDEFGGKDGDGFNDIEDGHESSNIETAPLSREISPSASGPSSSVEPMSSRKRKRSSMTPSYPRRRNAWTRWPLLADDVYVPEWSLEDEISLLAANVLKLHPRPPLPVLPSQSFPSSDDHDQGDGDIPSYLPPLTHSASTYLSTILALLIAHTPNRPLSQQNRIEPIGWRAVLDMLSSCGDPSVANQKIITSVKTRMEAIYGPSADETSGDMLAAQRIQSSVAAKEKLRIRLSRPMEDLLRFAEPPAPCDTAAEIP